MNTFISIATIIVSIIIAIPVFCKMYYGQMVSLTVAIILHFVSAFFFTIGMYQLTSKKTSRKVMANIWWVFSMSLAFILPVFGILIPVSVYMLHIVRSKRIPPIIDEDIVVTAPDYYKKIINRAKQLEILERIDIEPFVDILTTGSTDLKRGAIKQLGNIKSREAIMTLIEALKDSDIEIRLYAAGLLGKLEEEYMRQIKSQTKAFEEEPTNLTGGINLVDNYLIFTESGLLDKWAKNYNYKESLSILNILTENIYTNFLRARVYYYLGDYEKSETALDYCLKEKPEATDYNELKLEILMEERDLTDLRRNIERIEKKDIKIKPDVRAYWKQT